MLHVIRYDSVPFERARDHPRPPPPCRETPSNAHPTMTPSVDLRCYTSSTPHLHCPTFTLSQESAARGAGRALGVWGVLGVQPSAGMATGASVSAILVVGTAHNRMHLKICRSNAILALSVGPWRCSMRACAFPIPALHGGMRGCARMGPGKITSPPPTPVHLCTRCTPGSTCCV